MWIQISPYDGSFPLYYPYFRCQTQLWSPMYPFVCAITHLKVFTTFLEQLTELRKWLYWFHYKGSHAGNHQDGRVHWELGCRAYKSSWCSSCPVHPCPHQSGSPRLHDGSYWATGYTWLKSPYNPVHLLRSGWMKSTYAHDCPFHNQLSSWSSVWILCYELAHYRQEVFLFRKFLVLWKFWVRCGGAYL